MVGLRVALAVMRPLPIAWVSAIGAVSGRLVGQFSPNRRQRVLDNLAWLRPEDDARERARRARRYWRSIGRFVVEYAVLDRFVRHGYTRIVGAEHMRAAADQGRRVQVVTLHLANFEVGLVAANALEYDVPGFYRPPRDPGLDHLLAQARRRAKMRLFAKTRSGTRKALRYFDQPEAKLALVIDERDHRGLQVPAFGRKPNRADALDTVVRLAERADCLIAPCRVIRRGGAWLTVTVEPMFDPPRDQHGQVDAARLRRMINEIAERWVRERPEEWLWLQHWTPPASKAVQPSAP